MLRDPPPPCRIVLPIVDVIGSLKTCFGSHLRAREGVKIGETMGLDGPQIVQNPDIGLATIAESFRDALVGEGCPKQGAGVSSQIKKTHTFVQIVRRRSSLTTTVKSTLEPCPQKKNAFA